MVVEVIELESGRPVAELAAALEAQGGALVVLKWRRGNPTIANLLLPGDDARHQACRHVVDQWRMAASVSESSTGGPSWPLGHPRHQLDLRIV